jgi:hypothetical protein
MTLQANNNEFINSALATLELVHILTPENRALIIQNAQYALGIANVFSSLQLAGILTQDNINATIQNAQYAELIANALHHLAEVGRLNQDSFDAVIQTPEDADNTVYELTLSGYPCSEFSHLLIGSSGPTG